MAKAKKTKSGLGRKSLPAGKKKVEVRFFIEQWIVDELGGIDEAKVYAKSDLEDRAAHADISAMP